MANQPTEQARLSEEVIIKLQERATVLTQERKRRGRTVPEELISQNDLRSFRTLASHTVSKIIFSHQYEVLWFIQDLRNN